MPHDESLEQHALPKEGACHGKVIALAAMSLDGYISKNDNTIGRLFDWLQNGEVEFTTATEGMTVDLSPHSAKQLGLLDEVAVDLVPVVMGKGRPFFGEMPIEDAPLGDPTSCVRETGSPICGSP